MLFHVQVSLGKARPQLFNLSEDDLVKRIVTPWKLQATASIDGRRMDFSQAEVTIFEGPELSRLAATEFPWVIASTTFRNVTDVWLRDDPDTVVSAPRRLEVAANAAEPTVNPRKVMVVYGRDVEANLAMFGFLRSLAVEPIEWEQAVQATKKSSPFTKDAVQAAFAIAQAVVVLLTPDDEVSLHPDLCAAGEGEETVTAQARPNVYIELGMALASHPDRVVLVEIGRLRSASDIHGMNVVRLDGNPGGLQSLKTRLETAEVVVDSTGTDWLRADRFAYLAARTRTPSPRAGVITVGAPQGVTVPALKISADSAQARLVSAITKYDDNPQLNELIFQISNDSAAAIYDVRWFHATQQGSWTKSPEPITMWPNDRKAMTAPAQLNRAVVPGVMSGFVFRDNAGVDWIKWGNARLEEMDGDGGLQIAGPEALARMMPGASSR